MGYEEHAAEFLKYAAEHEEDIRKSAKGNWNEDIYHDTIIRVYDIIMKRKEAFIQDFGYYLKRAYYCQMLQDKIKSDAERDLLISTDYDTDILDEIDTGMEYEEIESKYQFYDKALYDVIRYVFENYDPVENEIWRMKRLNGYTYKKIEEITDINFYKLQKTVAKIDKDIKKFNLRYENI